MAGSAAPIFGDQAIFGPQGQIVDVEAILRLQFTGEAPRRNRAYCKVYMNGLDLTSKLQPVLLALRVTDRKFGASTCNLSIDDRYGQIPNPPDGSRIMAAIGWPDEGSPKQFAGVLSNIVSMGQRQGGRQLDLEFTSYDMGSNGKTQIKGTWGEGKDVPEGQQARDIPFSEIAGELAKAAGIKNFNIAPSIGQITRKHWSVNNESPNAALERLARELGGSYKADNEGGGIADPRSGQAADGTTMPTQTAIVGRNVLAWRVIPSVVRAQWGSLAQGFFDRDKAVPMVESASPDAAFGFGRSIAKHMGFWPANDAAMAETSAKADVYTSVAKRGTGWIVVDGMPTMVAGGRLSAHGMRPGVDGVYTADEVEQSYFRGGGYTTRIDVEDPQLYDNSSIKRQWSDFERTP